MPGVLGVIGRPSAGLVTPPALGGRRCCPGTGPDIGAPPGCCGLMPPPN